jgi:hypothetical protein
LVVLFHSRSAQRADALATVKVVKKITPFAAAESAVPNPNRTDKIEVCRNVVPTITATAIPTTSRGTILDIPRF